MSNFGDIIQFKAGTDKQIIEFGQTYAYFEVKNLGNYDIFLFFQNSADVYDDKPVTLNPREKRAFGLSTDKIQVSAGNPCTLELVLYETAPAVETVVNVPGTLNTTVTNFPDPQNVQVQNFPASQDVQVTNFPNPLNVQVQNFPATPVQKLEPRDLAGKMEVSNAKVQFTAFFEYGLQSMYWGDSGNANGGTSTHSINQSSVDMNVTTAAGSKARRRTHTRFRYQPGNPLRTFMSFIFAGPKANLVQRVGLYDDNNGFYLKLNNALASLVIRTSAGGSLDESREVTQNNWNIDTLDGNGPSGITVDWTLPQLLVVDFLWLGVGPIKFYLDLDGVLVPFHMFVNSNNSGISTVYMGTPNLPMTYEIENTGGTVSPSTMKQICATIQSLGGIDANDLKGDLRTVYTDASPVPTQGTEKVIVAIRPKLNFGGKLNGGQILPYLIKSYTSDNEDILYRCYVGGAFDVEPTWVDNGPSSITEYIINPSETYLTATAIELLAWYNLDQSADQGQLAQNFLNAPLQVLEDNTTQLLLVITGVNLTGGTADARVALGLKEVK